MANDFAPANRLWFKLKPIYSELAKGLCLVQIGLYFMFSQMANALAVQICPLNKIAVIESREWNRRSLKVVQTDHRKRPIAVGKIKATHLTSWLRMKITLSHNFGTSLKSMTLAIATTRGWSGY